jgi:hypothetical protein
MKRPTALEVEGTYEDFDENHTVAEYDGDDSYPTPKKSKPGSDDSDSGDENDGAPEENKPKKKPKFQSRFKPSMVPTRMPLTLLKIRDPSYKPVAQTVAFRKFDPNTSLKRQFKVPAFTNGEKPEAYGNGGPPVLGMLRRINVLSRGLHDPEEDGAIVLYGMSLHLLRTSSIFFSHSLNV